MCTLDILETPEPADGGPDAAPHAMRPSKPLEKEAPEDSSFREGEILKLQRLRLALGVLTWLVWADSNVPQEGRQPVGLWATTVCGLVPPAQ